MSQDVYTMVPINKSSGSVVSQKGCQPDKDLNRNEIIERIAYLNKKRNDLKQKLGITSYRQRKNIMYKFNKKTRKSGGHPQPGELLDYIKTGEEIQKLQKLVKLFNENELK